MQTNGIISQGFVFFPFCKNLSLAVLAWYWSLSWLMVFNLQGVMKVASMLQRQHFK